MALRDLFSRGRAKAPRPRDPNAPPGKFVLATGSGHCGTKWLATVLHRPEDRMACYHEQKAAMANGQWHAALEHEFHHGVDEAYAAYFAFIDQQRALYDVVGDSGSWTMRLVPDVAARTPVDHVVYLVRNGIQTVHSQFYQHAEISRSDFLYTHFSRGYWELLGQPGGGAWESYSDWEIWCFNWSINGPMPGRLQAELGEDRCELFRLEDLVSDADRLLGLVRRLQPATTLTREDAERLQGTDVNRKVQGDRSPEALWAKWTDEQRAAFTRICGPAMERYGYAIPPRP